MPFISEMIRRPVVDVEGRSVGSLEDIIAVQLGDKPHPKIAAIEVRSAGKSRLIPVGEVVALFAPVIPLNKIQSELSIYTPGVQDTWLVREVLDKQIIDTDGVRVVRVNDLELSRAAADVYVANVDISSAGLLRRLGMEKLAARLRIRGSKEKQKGQISWDYVELLGSDQPMRLKVPGRHLAELHPADLAEIVSDLTSTESSRLLDTLDVKTLADTLEEVEPDFQAHLVESMPDERVADVLEEMSPDEAADLLAELPEERSTELLRLMETDEAEDVRRLLKFPEDSAGGIMNTEFLSVRAGQKASEVIDFLREHAEEAETAYYIYVMDDERHLIGVFSLRALILNRPESLVADFMEKRVVSVQLLDTQEDAAQLVSKYNLLALPVVNDQNQMQGIVTADDALDKIIPTAWKKRLPRLYR